MVADVRLDVPKHLADDSAEEQGARGGGEVDHSETGARNAEGESPGERGFPSWEAQRNQGLESVTERPRCSQSVVSRRGGAVGVLGKAGGPFGIMRAEHLDIHRHGGRRALLPALTGLPASQPLHWTASNGPESVPPMHSVLRTSHLQHEGR